VQRCGGSMAKTAGFIGLVSQMMAKFYGVVDPGRR
jgi:hypothetical protein